MKEIQKPGRISRLIKKSEANNKDLLKLSKFRYSTNYSTFLKKLSYVELDTTPTYYDLYNFDGITYSTGETSPSPASAYSVTVISGSINAYSFIYPIYGFSVPIGEEPEDYTDGATPWTFKTTLAIIKSITHFPKMPEWAIDGAKLISYLYKQDGSIVQNLKVVLRESGQNLNELSVDLTEFYRWIELSEGYNFEHYAMYPLPENEEIFLNSKLYFFNPKNYHAKSKKVKQIILPVSEE